jgi:galactokinase
MVALVEEEQVEAFAKFVEQDYAQRTGIQPYAYPVRPAAGAGLL